MQAPSSDGGTDYERYMRTEILLSLQRRPEDVIHRDELLFQTVHQCTELLLKLGCAEVNEGTRLLKEDKADAAARLLGRASECVTCATDNLGLLRHLNPSDFQIIRTVLGNGSGLQSPGWRTVREVSADLRSAFEQHIAKTCANISQLYRNGVDTPLYRLAEAMIEWDERISIWRVRHFKLAVRIIGEQGVGTRGMPVDGLRKLIDHKFFPDLWAVRDELGQMGATQAEACVSGNSARAGQDR